jgi:hypothetical protein
VPCTLVCLLTCCLGSSLAQAGDMNAVYMVGSLPVLFLMHAVYCIYSSRRLAGLYPMHMHTEMLQHDLLTCSGRPTTGCS